MGVWHHQLNGHEFESTLGVGDGQGGLACYNPWVAKSWHSLCSLCSNFPLPLAFFSFLPSRFSIFTPPPTLFLSILVLPCIDTREIFLSTHHFHQTPAAAKEQAIGSLSRTTQYSWGLLAFTIQWVSCPHVLAL